MTVSHYRVAGMDCAAEEQLVRMALAEVPGVTEVEVRLEDREVRVAHAAGREAVDRALDGLGLGSVHLGDDAGTIDGRSAGPERPALWFALAVNAAFFVGELTFGLLSGSMGLVADSLDMGADAAVYAVSLVAVGATAARKSQLARTSGFLQILLACGGLIEVLRRLVGAEAAPEPVTMAVVSALALAGNVAVLLVLRRVRTGEAHIEASWIFTANDVKVNLLVLAAAAAVALTGSAIPDLLAGAFIFLVVVNGARRIFAISR